jgi:hypothetical protein
LGSHKGSGIHKWDSCPNKKYLIVGCKAIEMLLCPVTAKQPEGWGNREGRKYECRAGGKSRDWRSTSAVSSREPYLNKTAPRWGNRGMLL